MIKLSIVSTMFKSSATIEEFIKRASLSAERIANEDYEIILVNDCSTDNSLHLAVEASKEHANIKVINLSRNFGHHKALMTGLSYASGEKIFLIDSDLEEEPELLTSFNTSMEELNADVIYGIQKSRKGNLFEKISGWLFFSLFEFITNLNYPKNVLTARLMKRKYVDSLLMHKETELYLIGIWKITGFSQVGVKANKKSLSKSNYTLSKKLDLVINSIVSFTDRPLKFIFYSATILSIIIGIYLIYLFSNFILFGNSVMGWTSLVMSISFFGCINIMVLGLLGLYLSKIYIETKRRPYVIIEETYLNGRKAKIPSRINMNA